MLLSLFLIFLSMHHSNGFLSNLCTDVYPNDAKNIFLHFIDVHSVHNNGKDYCENFASEALTDILQMQLIINKINYGNKSEKFGVLTCDTCADINVTSINFIRTISFINKNQKNLLAIITNIVSGSLKQLLMLHSQYDLKAPILAYASTYSTVSNDNNRNETKTKAIQIVPNDSYKAEATLKLVDNQNCNYLSVLTTDDFYSLSFLEDFRFAFDNNNYSSKICLNIKLVLKFNSDDSNNAIRNSISSILSLYKQNEDVLILFLGYTNELIRLLKELNNTLASDKSLKFSKISILCYETTIYDLEGLKFNPRIQVNSILLNQFDASEQVEITVYYKSLIAEAFNNTSRKLLYTKIPSLLEHIMQTSECKFSDSASDQSLQTVNFNKTCDSLSPISSYYQLHESQYVKYMIYSMGVLHSQINTFLNRKECENLTISKCITSDVLEEISKNLLNGDFDLHLNPLVPSFIQGRFSIKNGIYESNFQDLYQLWNLTTGNKLHNYIDGDWSGFGNNFFGKAVCLHECTACLPRPELYISKGDVYIIFMLTLRSSDEPGAQLHTYRDYLIWQAVSLIREPEYTKIGDLKVGFVVIDTEYSEHVTYSKLKTLELEHQEVFKNKIGIINTLPTILTQTILGYVRQHNIITLSTTSTADKLSDYPNFCRAVANDSMQISVMIEILNQLDIKCVFGIYSNNAYGIGSDSQMRDLTKLEKNKITYRSLKVNNNYDKVFEEIKKYESDVIIMFMNLHDIKGYFSYLNETKGYERKKFYLSGDGWDIEFKDYREKTYGVVTIQLGINDSDTRIFAEKLADKYSNMGRDNESYFSDEYFNYVLKCDRPKSFSNFYKPFQMCDNNYPKRVVDHASDSSRQYKTAFENSYKSLLQALSSYAEENCRNDIDFKACVLRASNGSTIKQRLKDTVLPGDLRVFDEKCNGNIKEYTIYQFKGNPDPQFKKIGFYKDGNLTADVKKYILQDTDSDYKFDDFKKECEPAKTNLSVSQQEKVDECENSLLKLKISLGIVTGVSVFLWIFLIIDIFVILKRSKLWEFRTNKILQKTTRLD